MIPKVECVDVGGGEGGGDGNKEWSCGSGRTIQDSSEYPLLLLSGCQNSRLDPRNLFQNIQISNCFSFPSIAHPTSMHRGLLNQSRAEEDGDGN